LARRRGLLARNGGFLSKEKGDFLARKREFLGKEKGISWQGQENHLARIGYRLARSWEYMVIPLGEKSSKTREKKYRDPIEKG
jgi:hypothetical protein